MRVGRVGRRYLPTGAKRQALSVLWRSSERRRKVGRSEDRQAGASPRPGEAAARRKRRRRL